MQTNSNLTLLIISRFSGFPKLVSIQLKQDTFVEIISQSMSYFRETCKSQNLNDLIYLIPKFTWVSFRL